MAHDHRMNPIADPYLTQRSRFPKGYVPHTDIGMIYQGAENGDSVNNIRHSIDLHSTEAPSLQGRSNMQADTEYDSDGYPNDATTDEDTMPAGANGTPLPINPAVRAFQESGQGFSIRKGRAGQ